MGANDQEADATITKADFVHKYSIVKKECKETVYLLNIIKDTNSTIAGESQALINEGIEICKIVSTIINKTKNK